MGPYYKAILSKMVPWTKEKRGSNQELALYISSVKINPLKSNMKH